MDIVFDRVSILLHAFVVEGNSFILTPLGSAVNDNIKIFVGKQLCKEISFFDNIFNLLFFCAAIADDS